MGLSVEVVVPWRGGCEHRERAWAWLLPRWSAAYGWPVNVAESPDGPWVKAAAVMPAASRSAADVIVVADADVWCDGVPAAVDSVLGGAPWATPHGPVHRLTEVATSAVLADEPWPTAPRSLSQRPYTGHPGGGIVVLPRSAMLDVPLDPRFVGWGQEDDSWALALASLAGRPWRGRTPLWHLWHPPQARLSRQTGSNAGRTLWRRYQSAARNPARMRSLLEEISWPITK